MQQQGVRLAGLYRRTDNDENVEFFAGLAHALCGPAALDSGAFGSSSSSQPVPEQHLAPQARLPACPAAGCCRCVAMYEQLVEQGVHMFTRGLGHSEFTQLAATPRE